MATTKKTSTVSKTTKKMTPKKSVTSTKVKTSSHGATKKQSASKKSKRVLACAEGEQCFWATDGVIISNLVELRDALASMDAEVFTHHVTTEKNDFADWVEFVLGDTELAEKLKKTKKQNSAHTTVVTRLKIYAI